MKTSLMETVLIIFAMGAVIFSCRMFPFLLFREKKERKDSEDISKKEKTFLIFVEKTVPPVVMTVLAFNSIFTPVKESLQNGLTVLIASAFTVILHLVKKNPLISIFGGTAAFVLLERFVI